MGELRHVLHSQQFDRPLLEKLFRRADEFRVALDAPHRDPPPIPSLESRIVVNLFYEPSTRTRISFSVGGFHLGIAVESTENAREFSSVIKGERLEDTIRVLGEYRPDAIVLRHHETGAAERAAAVSSVPIINAGDGAGQHPTQALLDLYTIQREKGRVDGLCVAMGGDLEKGRTVRSLAELLAKFDDIQFIFVSPPQLRMRADITAYLTEQHVLWGETTSLEWALRRADVAYWTRLQWERRQRWLARLIGHRLLYRLLYQRMVERYAIGRRELVWMKSDAIIMHLLPRNEELKPEVDDDPRAVYFRQAGNGMFIRMALLEWVLEAR